MSSRLTLIAAVLISGSLPASADGLDAERFDPAGPTTGMLAVDSARLADAQRLAFAVGLVFARDLLVARDAEGNAVMDVVGNRLGLQLVGDYGLSDRIQLGLILPIVLAQNGDTSGLRSSSLPGQAIGDVRLRAKVGIASLGASTRVQIAGSLLVQIPNGNALSFAGGSGVEVEPAGLISVSSGRGAAALRVGYRLRERTVLANLIVDDEIAIAAGVAIGVQENLSIIGEVSVGLGIDGGERERPVELLAGGKLGNGGGWSVRPAVGFGLTHGYGAPSVRGLAIVSYEIDTREPLAPGDRDRDRIIDERDRCPDEAEDLDAVEDADGCPDPDNDNDGMFDTVDRCPLAVGPPDNQGCPDVDTDNDGIVDRLDRCPAEPEDVDAFQDDDGCPDLDNDSDGILDAADRCPRDSEDLDAFEDTDGCPELDNDGDGTPDGADGCPYEPETFNGVDDNDGCPDAGKVLVVLTPGKIEIKEQVQFATGKATIKRPSFRLLATVAKVLILHPEIKKLRVEGYTDSRGNTAFNHRLSSARAEAVLRHLIAVNGIDAARLDAVGFGADNPIADNRTAAGRAANRRVEFVIAERVPEPTPPDL